MPSALAAFDDMETSLRPVPAFPVEAPDGRRAWSEIDRQATFRGLMRTIAPSLIVWAQANAGKRNPMQAQKEGITAGVFDMSVASGTVGHRFIAFPEFKGYTKSGPGRLSPAQIDWGNRMYAAGHHVACFFSPDAAVEWIRSIAPATFIDRRGL